MTCQSVRSEISVAARTRYSSTNLWLSAGAPVIADHSAMPSFSVREVPGHPRPRQPPHHQGSRVGIWIPGGLRPRWRSQETRRAHDVDHDVMLNPPVDPTLQSEHHRRLGVDPDPSMVPIVDPDGVYRPETRPKAQIHLTSSLKASTIHSFPSSQTSIRDHSKTRSESRVFFDRPS